MRVRRKQTITKRSLVFIVVASLLLGSALGAVTSQPVFADSNIDLSDEVLQYRIGQRSSGDCAIASMATIEAYYNGLKNNSLAAYQTVWHKNGQQEYIQSWTNLGYQHYGLGDKYGGDIQKLYQEVYDQLESGTPCLVRRNSSPTHYSVIVGYSGDPSSFEAEDFTILEVAGRATDEKALKNLEKWIAENGGTDLNQVVIRKAGIGKISDDFTGDFDENDDFGNGAIDTGSDDRDVEDVNAESDIRISGQTYPNSIHKKGSFCLIQGKISSARLLTSVTASICTSSGKTMYTKTVTPKAKTYDLKGVDNDMLVSDLQTGSYVYRVTATDSAGYTEEVIDHSFAVTEEVTSAIGSTSSFHTANLITLQINDPVMYINGEASHIDGNGTAPIIRNDHTVLPVRAVMESMGASVEWNEIDQIVTLNMGGKELNLQINNRQAWDASGKSYSLASAPVIINERTMLPIRFVVEYFGGAVEWSESAQMVAITYEKRVAASAQ